MKEIGDEFVIGGYKGNSIKLKIVSGKISSEIITHLSSNSEINTDGLCLVAKRTFKLPDARILHVYYQDRTSFIFESLEDLKSFYGLSDCIGVILVFNRNYTELSYGYELNRIVIKDLFSSNNMVKLKDYWNGKYTLYQISSNNTYLYLMNNRHHDYAVWFNDMNSFEKVYKFWHED